MLENSLTVIYQSLFLITTTLTISWGGGAGLPRFWDPPTQNAWDPHLTRRAGTKTQNEKS